MRSRSSKRAGGVLLVVLCAFVLSAALVGGWVALVSSQVHYVEQAGAAMGRRIAFHNATALAKQAVFSNFLTKSTLPAVAFDFGNGWGAISIGEMSGAPLLSFEQPNGINHFNAGNGGGYTRNIQVDIEAGGRDVSRIILARSRSTVLSGIVAISHTPGTTISGTASTFWQTLVWQSAGSISLASGSFVFPAAPANAITNPDGVAVAPSNFPFVPITGSEIGGVPAFNGSLNVIANQSGINSLLTMAGVSAPNGVRFIQGSTVTDSNGLVCDGAGVVTLDLLNPALGHVVMLGEVTQLIIEGQTNDVDRIAADDMAPVVVISAQDSPVTDLAQVDLADGNARRLILAIKSPTGNATTVNFTTPGGGTWRGVMVFESTPVTFQMFGGARTLIGGWQSDRDLAIANGSVGVAVEPDPKLMDRLTARDGWLEIYSLP